MPPQQLPSFIPAQKPQAAPQGLPAFIPVQQDPQQAMPGLAKQYGVDPELMRRIIQQESGWNPQAENPQSHAYGLTQLMPETAKRWGVDPRDPMANLRGGIQEFAQRYKESGGDLNKALTAYGGFKTKDPQGYIRAITQGYQPPQQQLPAFIPAQKSQQAPQQAGQPFAEPLQRGLEAAYKYGVQPFEKLGQIGTEAGGDIAAAGLHGTSPYVESAQRTMGIAPQDTMTGAARGVGGIVGGAVSDPRNWPFMAGSMARPLLERLISGGFAVQMGEGTYEGAKNLYENWDKMTPAQRSEAITSSGLGALMSGGAALHAVTPRPARIDTISRQPVAPTIQAAPPRAEPSIEQLKTIGGLRTQTPDVAREGAVAPATAAGVTGAREVTGGAPAAAASAPLEQPTPPVGTVQAKPTSLLTGVRAAAQKFSDVVSDKGYQPTPEQLEAARRDTERNALLYRFRRAYPNADYESLKSYDIDALRNVVERAEKEQKVKPVVPPAKPSPFVPRQPEGPPSEATRRQQDKAMTERAQAGIQAKREATAAQAPKPPMSREEQLELHEKYPTLFAHPDATMTAAGGAMRIKGAERAPETPRPTEAAPASTAPTAPREPVRPTEAPAGAAGKPVPAAAEPVRVAGRTPQQEAANTYREAIKRAKALGIDFEKAPPEVKESLLKLHQNALMEWAKERGYSPKAGGGLEAPPKTPAAAPAEPVEPGKPLPSPAPSPEAPKAPIADEDRKWLEGVLKKGGNDAEATKTAIKTVMASVRQLPEQARNAAAKAAIKTLATHLKGGKEPGYATQRAQEVVNRFKGEAGFIGGGRKAKKAAQEAALKKTIDDDKPHKIIEAIGQHVANLPEGTVDARIKAARDAVQTNPTTAPGRVRQSFANITAHAKVLVDWYKNGERTGIRLKDAWQGLTDPKEAYKKAVGRLDDTQQVAAKDLRDYLDDVRAAHPREILDAMTLHIDTGGDAALLQAAAGEAKLPTKLREAAKLAQNLSPAELKTVEKIKSYYDDIGQELMKTGALRNMLEHYINHIYGDDNPLARGITAEAQNGLFNTNFKYANQRIHKTLIDAAREGKTPLLGVDHALALYHKYATDALSSRAALKELSDGTAADKRPLLVPGWDSIRPIVPEEYSKYPAIKAMLDASPKLKKEIAEGYFFKSKAGPKGPLLPAAVLDALKIPYDVNKINADENARIDVSDYKHVNHPSFKQTIYIGEGPKGPIFYRGDLYAHPSIHGDLENLFERSQFRKYAVTRAALEFTATTKRMLLSWLPSGFHYTQEGWHAVGHTVNPFDRKVWSGETVNAAMNNSLVREGMQHGLKLFDFNAAETFGEGIGGDKGLVGAMREHLFNKFVPGLKVKLFEKQFAENFKIYEKKGYTRDRILEMTAQQVNNAFGMQDQIFTGRSKFLQDLFRLTALAPDFLESRARFVGSALRPGGRQQLKALLRQGMYMYTTARVVNALYNDGDAKWDPKDAFTAHIKGKTVSIRSVLTDAMFAATDPGGFIATRGAILPRAFAESYRQFREKPFLRTKGSALEAAVRATFPIIMQDTVIGALRKGYEGKYGESVAWDTFKGIMESMFGARVSDEIRPRGGSLRPSAPRRPRMR